MNLLLRHGVAVRRHFLFIPDHLRSADYHHFFDFKFVNTLFTTDESTTPAGVSSSDLIYCSGIREALSEHIDLKVMRPSSYLQFLIQSCDLGLTHSSAACHWQVSES